MLQEPFGNSVYIVSTVLDPTWGNSFFSWFAKGDSVGLMQKIKGMYATMHIISTTTSGDIVY